MRVCVVALKGKTLTTGRLLACELGVELVSDATRNDYDLAIRWGCTHSLCADVVINPSDTIQRAANKCLALGVLQDADIPIPQTLFRLDVDNVRDMIPCFLRTTHHQGGRGLVLLEHEEDLEGIDLREFSHATKLITKVQEWRIHTGEALGVTFQFGQRKLRHPEALPSHLWNYKSGYTFNHRYWGDVPEPIARVGWLAREALGLHFGAADVVVDRDGHPFVLEVNTAPGLTIESSQEEYLRFFKEIMRRLSNV